MPYTMTDQGMCGHKLRQIPIKEMKAKDTSVSCELSQSQGLHGGTWTDHNIIEFQMLPAGR